MSATARPALGTSLAPAGNSPSHPHQVLDGDRPTRRSRRFRRLASLTAATLLAAALAPLMTVPAQAATAGMSPVDPQNGYPTWFSDGTTKLQFCYMAGAGCLSEPPNPDAPASYPDNFPEEAFWFNAEASGGNLRLYEAALEGAHANGAVVPGEQMGFGRLRFRIDNLVTGASYTIKHPYGSNTFTATAVSGAVGRVYQTIDAGSCAPTATRPCDWAGVGEAFLGDNAATTTSTFLKQVGAPAGTLGDINTARAVTGAPSGLNAVTITGPNAGGLGVNTLTVSNFTVQGLIFNGADAAPSSPDLATANDSGKSSTDNITNVTKPTLTGTVPGVGATEATVELVEGTTVVGAASTLNGAYSIAPDVALTPGVHRLAARTPNPAFTPGSAVAPFLTSGALTFTVDTAPPAVAMGTTNPSNPTADTTPTLTFTGEAGASFECQLLPSNATWDPSCLSPKTYDQQLAGLYTFNVRATDVAGNVSAPATYKWQIGQSDIVAPSVTSRTPANGTASVTATSNVTATFSEAVQGVSGTTFTLKTAAGAAVAAGVTYNATTRVATLDPTASLAAGTTYTATLTGGISDGAGNALSATSWTFSTPPATTNAAPTVTTRAPAANGLAFSTTGNITATFSEAVQAVSGTTFKLKNAAGTAVAGAVTYNAATRVATLNPTATLANDTKYTATLTGGSTAIRDTANLGLATTSWTFTTGPAPTVSTRVPATSSTGRSQTANITATFSENVAGVSGSTFTLKTPAGAVVPAVVTYSATTRTATLNPNATLAADTKYTATLTGASATAIRDAAGNRLTTSSWTFTTGPAPTITARTPASGATAVSRTANVTATFSEVLATGVVSGTTVKLKNATTGAAITAVVSYNTTTRVATLNPSATLGANTRYTATVTGGTTAVRDRAGNALTTSSWSFTTGA